MTHFFERDDLPGVSGKIIEEHGGGISIIKNKSAGSTVSLNFPI